MANTTSKDMHGSSASRHLKGVGVARCGAAGGGSVPRECITQLRLGHLEVALRGELFLSLSLVTCRPRAQTTCAQTSRRAARVRPQVSVAQKRNETRGEPRKVFPEVC
eukprot:1490547-Rhodomonas_salina.1